MNLYLIWQTEDNSYDTYDSAVVCASNEDEARHMDPSYPDGRARTWPGRRYYDDWCSSPDAVNVKLIGAAADGMVRSVVCSSFNAG
jgi:hypothetical protein